MIDPTKHSEDQIGALIRKGYCQCDACHRLGLNGSKDDVGYFESINSHLCPRCAEARGFDLTDLDAALKEPHRKFEVYIQFMGKRMKGGVVVRQETARGTGWRFIPWTQESPSRKLWATPREAVKRRWPKAELVAA